MARALVRLDLDTLVLLELGDLLEVELLHPLDLSGTHEREAGARVGHLFVDDTVVVELPGKIVGVGNKHRLFP